MSQSERIVRFCECGDSMDCEIAPKKYADKIIEIWEQVHSGIGHSPSNSNDAMKRKVANWSSRGATKEKSNDLSS